MHRACCGSLTVGCPPWGWGSTGPPLPGICLPGQGFPQPAPLHGTFTSMVSPLRLAGQGSYPLTWLRHPGPERGGDVPVQDDPAPLPGCLEASALLLPPLQDLLWAASFYARFLFSYIPFYGVPGALFLFVAVRYGQVWHGGVWGAHTQAAGAPDLSPPCPHLQNGDSTVSLGCRVARSWGWQASGKRPGSRAAPGASPVLSRATLAAWQWPLHHSATLNTSGEGLPQSRSTDGEAEAQV